MKTVNEVFNLRRFWAYAMRSWSLYAKKYLVHAGIYAGMMVLLLVLVAATKRPLIDYSDLMWLTPWYVFFILAFFATFPIEVMKPLKNRHTLVTENIVPASTTEKWLFVLLNTTVIAAILCAVALSLAVLAGMSIIGSEPFVEYFRYAIDEVPWKVYLVAVFGFLSAQSVVMFAGTQERRNHVVSLLLILALMLLTLLVLVGLSLWLKTGMTNREIMISSDHSMVEYFAGPSFRLDVGVVGQIGVTLLFWLTAWFNFRERSIK